MKHRILIIDSDRESSEYLRDCLAAMRFNCDIEVSGDRGLSAALEGKYCCIIIGDLPSGRDGFGICSAIRERLCIPVVFITRAESEASEIRAFSIGADDYITKPFSVSVTLARLQRHIARYLESSGTADGKEKNVIKIRGLEIHRDSHRVFLNGKEAAMPVKEYELLLFLAENPNMVFSKEHLLDRVWGIDAVGDSATVTVHIQRIRDKIESDGSRYIETVWGAGYRLRA